MSVNNTVMLSTISVAYGTTNSGRNSVLLSNSSGAMITTSLRREMAEDSDPIRGTTTYYEQEEERQAGTGRAPTITTAARQWYIVATA